MVPQPSETYLVKRGDTLGSIAARHGTTVLSLWQNNPQLGGTDRISPGQMLVLSYPTPKLGVFRGQRICVSEYRPARTAQDPALSDVLIRFSLRL